MISISLIAFLHTIRTNLWTCYYCLERARSSFFSTHLRLSLSVIMGILECSSHKSVASFFTPSAIGEAWTFHNFFTSFGDPHGDNNSDGKIQSTYKNSLIQVQKSCKNKCFTQRQRDWALQHLQFFDTKVSSPFSRVCSLIISISYLIKLVSSL